MLVFSVFFRIAIKNIGSGTIAAEQIRVEYRNDGHEGQEVKQRTLNRLNTAANAMTVLRFFR